MSYILLVEMEKRIKIITNPKSIRNACQETRRNILSLLGIKIMSISQLAKALNKHEGTIFRHVKKLEKGGFIEVDHKEYSGSTAKAYYRRTAEKFLMSPDLKWGNSTSIKEFFLEEETKAILGILEDMGYEIENFQKCSNIVKKIFKEKEELLSKDIKRLENSEDISIYEIRMLEFILNLLYLEKNEEFKENVKEFLNHLKDLKD